MGHQVTFLALPTDLPMIEAAIRTTGDVVFLDERAPTAEPVTVGTLAFGKDEMGQRPLGAHIVRRSDLDAVTTQLVEPQGYWVIDSLNSPVIEFTRPFFDGSVLRRGRAYFATDLKFRAELPPRDFVVWGDRVLAQIRKQLFRVPDLSPIAYVSPDARRWAEEHGAVGDNMLTFRAQRTGNG